MTRPNNITSDRFVRSGEHRHENGANNAVVWRVGDEDPKTNFRWRLSTRPSSDPDLRKTSTKSIKPLPDKPLKTCLKPKAKSANATPPNGSTTDIQSPLDNQKLRRVKTVDFEEAVSKPVPSRGFAYREEGQRLKHSKRTLSCPGTAHLAKRSPAYPAVTRADVHVIAVAPATPRYFGDSSPIMRVEEADPTTPTMQIVESSNGAYEIIWDDVPPEHDVRVRRHSSSASQALEAVNLTATRSLERVNTKLTEWSITWNAPSNSFKPTVVVFQDDDGYRPHSESVVINEDIEIFPPPNSERASAAQSRHASRPVSASTSRAASQEHLETMEASQMTSSEEYTAPVEHPLVDPDPDTWSAHLAAARRKIGEPGPARKLSNIDEADLKFRKHWDSVTIAQSRLIQSGSVRPELFAHKDSVTIAKKRMHAKNYASATSHHPHKEILQSGPDACTHEETSLPPLPLVKAHAAEALKTRITRLYCTE
ncbi:hypothetical protein N0V94_008465 [Neodidymelliopsis sp. IMI 364377]|nr:hypothetical protein N0V94_008465 [Neodidymelliopsis sp. IMI 364377]